MDLIWLIYIICSKYFNIIDPSLGQSYKFVGVEPADFTYWKACDE